jgi:hypothetical protein
MYQEIAAFPILKSSAVTSPPASAGRHAMCVSGNHLNSMAKSRVSTASEIAKLRKPRSSP